VQVNFAFLVSDLVEARVEVKPIVLAYLEQKLDGPVFLVG